VAPTSRDGSAGGFLSDARRLRAARELFELLAPALELGISIRLWDGSRVALGSDVDPRLAISIAGPGVLGSLLRRPTPETLVREYATGGIDLSGGEILEFIEALGSRGASRSRLSKVGIVTALRRALPLIFARHGAQELEHGFGGETTGRRESQRDNRDFIQFHYDVSNEFYALFLGQEMQYSCAYFTDWENSLEQAQLDKMEMICRKLHLEPGECLLDVGCGWGGLICYAAQKYGVEAHGVTLSAEQCKFAREKVLRLGLEDRVRVDLVDYASLDGQYDKIASIGMFEHIGLRNLPRYFDTLYRLLRNRGILLNHGIASRSKPTRRRRRRITPEKRLLQKYIFPGSELTNIGHTLQAMEHAGFEVHDVEGLREHYARTARAWCERLSERGEEASRLVGLERYRLWLAYTAGVTRGFCNGSMLIFQAVATKHEGHGPSGLPPTRRGLYEDW
jgi:cyclopropane-fatty-acyl-phospholipid synthase